MKQPYKNEKWLRNLYCVEKKTITEIAKITNSSPAQIYRYTKRFNLPRPVEFIGRCDRAKMINTLRAKQTLLVRGKEYTPISFYYRNKNWLIERYQKEKLSLEALAKLCGVNHTCILKWMKFHQIPRREQAIAPSRLRPNGMVSISGSGYRLVKQPDHPQATSAGLIREHRLVMEKHLGRYLTANEHVHHNDGDKQNNDISNLRLFTNREHKRFEQALQLFIKKLMYSPDLQFCTPYRDDLVKRFKAFLSKSE